MVVQILGPECDYKNWNETTQWVVRMLLPPTAVLALLCMYLYNRIKGSALFKRWTLDACASQWCVPPARQCLRCGRLAAGPNLNDNTTKDVNKIEPRSSKPRCTPTRPLGGLGLSWTISSRVSCKSGEPLFDISITSCCSTYGHFQPMAPDATSTFLCRSWLLRVSCAQALIFSSRDVGSSLCGEIASAVLALFGRARGEVSFWSKGGRLHSFKFVHSCHLQRAAERACRRPRSFPPLTAHLSCPMSPQVMAALFVANDSAAFSRSLVRTGAVITLLFSMAWWTIPLEHLVCFADEPTGQLHMLREPSMECSQWSWSVAGTVLYGGAGFLAIVFLMMRNFERHDARRWWMPLMMAVKVAIVVVALWCADRPTMQTAIIAALLVAMIWVEVRIWPSVPPTHSAHGAGIVVLLRHRTVVALRTTLWFFYSDFCGHHGRFMCLAPF